MRVNVKDILLLVGEQQVEIRMLQSELERVQKELGELKSKYEPEKPLSTLPALK